MTTEYIYRLHVICRDAAVAAQLSSLVYQQFPEVGPNNVGTPLVPVGGVDNATATAWEFNAPVRQEYIDWLATLIANTQLPSGVLWWVRSDRSDNLQKRHDDENPTPRVFTVDDGRAECEVKQRIAVR